MFEQPTSPKVGHYCPGTDVPVLSDDELSTLSPDALIVWAWHIQPEIVRYLRGRGFKGELYTPFPELTRIDS